MADVNAFIGTYTDGDSDGIYRVRVEDATADCSLAAESTDPAYLCVHPTGQYLYAVNERTEGAVTAFEIRPGGLSRLDQCVIGPADPCHCQVDATGRWLFVAHYHGRAISVVPIGTDGQLGDPTIITHEGSSVDPERQSEPHPHTIRPDPTNERVYVADLGIDAIVRYAFDAERGDLQRAGVTSLQEGAGPRQFDFGPDGRLYCLNELDSTLSTFAIEDDGALTHIETVGTVPADFEGENYPGGVAVHPSKRFVYSSNRGHDSIAVFERTEGGLQRVQIEQIAGEWPREFALTPDGGGLYAAAARSDSIHSFEIDRATGRIEPAGEPLTVPEPVCVRPY